MWNVALTLAPTDATAHVSFLVEMERRSENDREVLTQPRKKVREEVGDAKRYPKKKKAPPTKFPCGKRRRLPRKNSADTDVDKKRRCGTLDKNSSGPPFFTPDNARKVALQGLSSAYGEWVGTAEQKAPHRHGHGVAMHGNGPSNLPYADAGGYAWPVTFSPVLAGGRQLGPRRSGARSCIGLKCTQGPVQSSVTCTVNH